MEVRDGLACCSRAFRTVYKVFQYVDEAMVGGVLTVM